MAKVTTNPVARTIIYFLPLARRWGAKAGFAVLDQGLFAGTNFLMNILLARWLSPVEYGAFTVAYSVFLLLATLHTAILTEPMLVFGAGRYAEQFREYLGFILYGHASLAAVISFILAVVVLLFRQFGSVALAHALSGLAIASPFILLLWLLRRAFYVCFQPQWAATGGALYLLLMTAGLYGLYEVHWISPFWVLALMGVASAIVALWLIFHLKPRWRSTSGELTPSMVLSSHRAYGKWSTATTGLMWVPSNIYYTLLPVWAGLEGSAALRAVLNLIMPILQANSAISILLLPQFAKVFKVKGKTALHRFSRFVLIPFLIGSMLYWVCLCLFRHQVMAWLYSGGYAEYVDLLILAGGLPLSVSAVTVLANVLRAIEQPNQVFWCYVVSSLVTITLGLWLLATKGVAGAVAGLIASSVATAITMLWFWVQQHQ